MIVPENAVLPTRIFLCGLPAAGKTTVGQILARALGWEFLDLDHLIEKTAGKSIPEVFSESGEEHFRDLETAALQEVLQAENPCIIALGGGALDRPANQALLAEQAVVHLKVDPKTAFERARHEGNRPLLNGTDPEAKLQELAQRRNPIYQKVATIQVPAEQAPEQVARQICRELGKNLGISLVRGQRDYLVLVGTDLQAAILRSLLDAGDDHLIVHPEALKPAALELSELLEQQGKRVRCFQHADGEAGKSLSQLAAAWDLLGAEAYGRDCVITGLGGGATTDLAGFIGATWMRGVKTVMLPTSLLGMVDAAVGGKTGINTEAGKNLVGAFYPPTAVFCDLKFLQTLPEAELRNGMAEVIKCGFIRDPYILQLCQGIAPGTLPTGEVLQALIEAAVRVKAQVVSTDLFESGLREILNYGHTLGHAIEKAEKYQLPHGHGVSIGMVFAAHLAAELGIATKEYARDLTDRIAALGLPTNYAGSWPDLRDTMARDKKNRQGQLRFVLCSSPGQVQTYRVNDEDALKRAAQATGITVF
ncbi:3-dehydroquinate synthase [Boudabousia liubingyangii]|nr:3-dehydroquinate synthase [Boudabousia liubingyangii]